MHLESKKLALWYIQSFKILRRINMVVYCLALPRIIRINPTFHISCLKPLLCSLMGAPAQPVLPPPCITDRALAFTVRLKLNLCCVHGRIQYLVDWEGYRPEECSWVPTWCILDPELIRDFRRDCAAGL